MPNQSINQIQEEPRPEPAQQADAPRELQIEEEKQEERKERPRIENDDESWEELDIADSISERSNRTDEDDEAVVEPRFFGNRLISNHQSVSRQAFITAKVNKGKPTKFNEESFDKYKPDCKLY